MQCINHFVGLRFISVMYNCVSCIVGSEILRRQEETCQLNYSPTDAYYLNNFRFNDFALLLRHCCIFVIATRSKMIWMIQKSYSVHMMNQGMTIYNTGPNFYTQFSAVTWTLDRHELTFFVK